ncbi:MAG: ParB N-terminal domain-containing protein [Deltaproteobacteria bacterium]|nr:ParB N-terminal domain-containing protein [Deltaproteobacteria bacterium]
MEALNIAIKKVVQDQGIYPRFNTDIERIRLFAELLDCDTRFPPIKVVRENGFFVLLDGQHRLEAHRQAGKERIPCEVWKIKKEHRRLAAARFNHMSSKPLTAKELQKTIRDAWEIDEIREANEIATHLNCSVQYVRRVLQGVKQAEKEQVNHKIVEMKEEGLSERQIAEKVARSNATVHRVLQKETVSFRSTPKSGKKPTDSTKTPSCPQTAGCDPAKLQKNRASLAEKQPDTQTISAKSENTDVIEGINQADNTSSKISETLKPGTSNKPLEIDKIVKLSKSDESSVDENSATCGQDELVEPPSCIPSLSRVGKWKPGEKTCIRTIELVRANWPVTAIARKMDKIESWIRNTAVALLGVYQSRTDMHPHEGWTPEEIAERLDIEDSRVVYLAEFAQDLGGVLPDRETVFSWLYENQAPYQNYANIGKGSLMDIMRLEKIYRKCVHDGIQPPWEPTESPKFDELPKEFIEGLGQTREMFQKITEFLREGVLDNVLTELNKRLNWSIITLNNFQTALNKRISEVKK